jgi:predicted nucleic acid-binding protein
MTSPIFIDANIPIYAAGRPHSLKAPAIQLLEFAGGHPDLFFTDAEVLQELLHRYLVLHAWGQGQIVFAEFVSVMQGRIEPMLAGDVEAAASLVGRYPGLSARDLVHLSIMTRVGATQIVTADKGFDRVSQIQRLDPAAFETWVGQLPT